jgi:DNA-binding transcriptional ArsR family regulator
VYFSHIIEYPRNGLNLNAISAIELAWRTVVVSLLRAFLEGNALLPGRIAAGISGPGRPSACPFSVMALDITIKLYNYYVMQMLDATFSALADPTRRAILSRLATGEATVMELARPFAMSQPAISKHLKVLEVAGLIERRVEGARRPCRLAKPGVEAADQWLEMLRSALEMNYERLDRVLAEMKSEGRKPEDREETK